MNRLFKYLCIPILLVSLSLTAQARSYYPLGSDLLTRCQAIAQRMQGEKEYNHDYASWCLGFVQGALGSHYFYSVLLATRDKSYHKNMNVADMQKLLNKQRLFCIPTDVNLGQIIQLVVKYPKQNAEVLKQKATLMVYAALKKAYPCHGK